MPEDRAGDDRWRGVPLGDMTREELMDAMHDMAAGYEARLAERSGTSCPRCHGSGLIWLGTSSKRRARVNEDWEPCMAAFRCPVCPDDGSGNWVGTGRVDG